MLLFREQLEALEDQRLAPYAQRSIGSRGRMHPEPESKSRTAFQRDHDRIVHSAAFRRLEYKTQVFENEEGDYYRTRLTHTLEVAQIGRSIARTLGINEDLVESICLAHDLGHPPYGHAGEHALDRMMKDHGGFNHNYQSFRVVTELEHKYPNWSGLNLTIETLYGIAKHETNYDLSQAAGFEPELKGSLEAQIANATDELAYNAHDLDDGLIAGVIELDELNSLEFWRFLVDRIGWKGHKLDEITRHVLIRELIGVLCSDILDTTQQNLERIQPKSVEDIQRQPENIVGYSPKIHEMNKALKAFLYHNMYYSYRIIRMQQRADYFIERMFEAFLKDSRQLPPEWQKKAKEQDLHRTIADYIASLTDRSALLEYRRLFDPVLRP